MKKSTKPSSFDRRKCQSGLDGVNAEYVLEFADMKQLYLPPEELKNEAGNTIAKMECVGGKLKAYINVVHCIRPDNVSPLGIAEAIKAELIRERVFEFIQGYVQKHLKCQAIDECIYHMRVRAMECNLTLPCVGGAKPSDVIALLDLSLDKTADQHLDRGIAEIKKYCAEHDMELFKDKVYTDQQTGKNFNRPRYQMLKEEILESGDTLIVTELDRLGRNKKATLDELRFFQDNNIRVMVLELPTTLLPIEDTENSMARMMLETINNMMIELYASMAQAEMEKKEKRQREGIAAKKARGEWADYGRPRVMDLQDFARQYQAVERGEKKLFELMRELGMTKATFYRYKGLLKKEGYSPVGEHDLQLAEHQIPVFPHMSYIWSKGGDGYKAGRTVLQAEKANGGVPKKADGAEVPAEDHHLGDRG